MNPILEKYANLIVHYCLEIKRGDSFYLKSTTLAEPLVREVYREAVRAGANVEVDLTFREQGKIFTEEAKGNQLKYISPSYEKAIKKFDCYLYIRAPFNLKEEVNGDPKKAKIRSAALKPLNKVYYKRTGTRDLRRSLCQYPTLAAAQNAGMSLEDYQQFVYTACNLFKKDPIKEWKKVSKSQQKIVDLLNKRTKVQYKGEGIDITFSTKGRTWINSDGQTNMPSGEVYTAPVDDSVNGVVNFSFPAIYWGHEVEDVTLWVKDGYVTKWEAKHGKEFLDKIFKLKGTRRFGEAAIGTNYNITRLTKNMLFDEKMGGTIHMAIGQAYAQCGGKNQSSVHWDMLGNMKNGGEIFADDELIYKNGKFIF